jgi:phage I-like protein
MTTAMARLMRDFAAIKRANAAREVDTAIREGRLVAAQRQWGVQYCTSDPKGFAKFIAASPKILQTNADGTISCRIGELPAGVLTQRELMIAQNLGLTAEQFAAAKPKRAGR